MTRAQLSALLANLIRNNHLNVADARSVMAAFDAGLLTDLADLEALYREEDSDKSWVLALLAVLAMVGGTAGVPLNEAQRKRGRTLMRDGFEMETKRLAITVTQGGSILTWQKALFAAIASYTRKMAIAGAGVMPSLSVRLVVEKSIADQVPFLQRFSVQLAAQRLVGHMMSTVATAARSNLYGGNAWASWFLGHGQDAAWGYVERWVTRDDRFVCPRCAGRHGRYYLPGQGAMPGSDCYGSCRCQRVLEYNPRIYAELTGSRVAA